MEWRLLGAEGSGNGSHYLTGAEFQFCKIKNRELWRWAVGMVTQPVSVLTSELYLLNCTLKDGYAGKFDVRYHRKKKKKGKKAGTALTGVAQLVGLPSAKQKVTGSIPGQGTRLGCRFGPQLGVCKRQPIDVSLLYQCISPFLPPFPSL